MHVERIEREADRLKRLVGQPFGALRMETMGRAQEPRIGKRPCSSRISFVRLLRMQNMRQAHRVVRGWFDGPNDQYLRKLGVALQCDRKRRKERNSLHP